jgi:hypothetical protein
VPVVRISAVNEKDDIIVKVEIANRGSTPYQLLEWNLSTEGLPMKTVFRVYRGNQEVFYKGILIKRRISESDFITVNAGYTCTTEIGLGQVYDIRPKGRYRIHYETVNERLEGERVDRLKSNVIVVKRK